MKLQISLLLLLTLLMGCSNSGQKNTADEKAKCKHSVPFGDIEICLPEIDGMTECYERPNVKALADKFEYEGNEVKAFYINNETYKKVDSLDKIVYDDYFKIYITKTMTGQKAGTAQLDEMTKMLEGNFLQENWDELKGKLNKSLDFISVGQPVLVENYSPHKNIRTFIMLIKYQMEGYEQVIVGTMDILLIKDRLVWLAYYKNYDGEESIKKAKAKNDYIALRVMEVN